MARRWATEHLRTMYDDPGETAEDAALVVSELVTNCLRAQAHTFGLALEGHQGSLRVEATDDAPGVPTLRAAHVADPQGRGLLIVDKVAADWGVAPVPPGKTVWAELPVPSDATPTFDCTTS